MHDGCRFAIGVNVSADALNQQQGAVELVLNLFVYDSGLRLARSHLKRTRALPSPGPDAEALGFYRVRTGAGLCRKSREKTPQNRAKDRYYFHDINWFIL
jgi:hypothetical protein